MTKEKAAPKAAPFTESMEVYPAGRGKILAIIKKSLPTKPRKYRRRQPRFCHARVKMNPTDLTVAEYLGDGNRKYRYLFPQRKQLYLPEIEDLALSLLAMLPRYLGKGKHGKCRRNAEKYNYRTGYPIFLTRRQRQILKRKWRRYQRWREKHQ